MPAGVTFWKKKVFFFQTFRRLYLEEYLELGAHIWRGIGSDSEKPKNGLDL